MSYTMLIYALLASLAGACIALQATANSAFRKNLESPWYAAFFSVCGTIITASLFMVLFRPATPTWENLKSTSWWNWIGGPLGAMIVLAGAALVQRLGAAPFIALVVAGQLICSMILDHFALMNLQENPITWGRVLGAVLVVGGVICIKYL